MGVTGLYSYIKENHSDNFIAYELHNSPVVFDGNNVAYALYRHSKLSKQFDGENLAFEIYIEKFINEMKQCEIKPIFVFDGLHEVSHLSFLYILCNKLFAVVNHSKSAFNIQTVGSQVACYKKGTLLSSGQHSKACFCISNKVQHNCSIRVPGHFI